MTKRHDDVPLSIHYPKSEEVLAGEEYTFRIMTRMPGLVEISIDEGPWRRCRPAVGYWWYDWICDGDGEHVLSARMSVCGQSLGVTDPRRFCVKRAPAAGKCPQGGGEDGPEAGAPGRRTARAIFRRWTRDPLTQLKIFWGKED